MNLEFQDLQDPLWRSDNQYWFYRVLLLWTCTCPLTVFCCWFWLLAGGHRWSNKIVCKILTGIILCFSLDRGLLTAPVVRLFTKLLRRSAGSTAQIMSLNTAGFDSDAGNNGRSRGLNSYYIYSSLSELDNPLCSYCDMIAAIWWLAYQIFCHFSFRTYRAFFWQTVWTCGFERLPGDMNFAAGTIQRPDILTKESNIVATSLIFFRCYFLSTHAAYFWSGMVWVGDGFWYEVGIGSNHQIGFLPTLSKVLKPPQQSQII
jgi:hypothetical protein